MTVAIYGKIIDDKARAYIRQLLALLEEKKFKTLVYEGFTEELKQQCGYTAAKTFSSHEEIKSGVQFFFSLGGDGTLLEALTLVRGSSIPIVGINIGRLGFLANIGKEEIAAALEALLRKDYVIDRRTLLQLDATPRLFGEMSFALNDFTLHKKDTSSMITITAYLNGEYLNAYWADGLVISTPTGATGYSLSCGGPILMPDAKDFIITPVAPHNLNVRPLVVPDTSVITLEVDGRGDSFLCTLDSRYETIGNNHRLSVKKADFHVNLLHLRGTGFLETLRGKLGWGQDKRN